MLLFRAENPDLHGRDQENVQEKSRASVIIDFIRVDSSISLRELSKKLGVSSKTVQREIEKLKAKNAMNLSQQYATKIESSKTQVQSI